MLMISAAGFGTCFPVWWFFFAVLPAMRVWRRCQHQNPWTLVPLHLMRMLPSRQTANPDCSFILFTLTQWILSFEHPILWVPEIACCVLSGSAQESPLWSPISFISSAVVSFCQFLKISLFSECCTFFSSGVLGFWFAWHLHALYHLS